MFDSEDEIYADHFPGNPIVPGSLIMHAFFKAAKEAGFSMKDNVVENFRFKSFIPPGEYVYDIVYSGSYLKCRLYDGEKTAVTGKYRICG